ncbi:MAG: PqqD family protein [Planctomycetota bacterium]
MRFAEHTRVRQEKFGAVVFETLKEKVFVTNEIGAKILRLLEQHQTPEEITTQLVSEYDDSPDLIKKDVQEFITDLINQSLLKKDDR